jgi:hypothetical protein
VIVRWRIRGDSEHLQYSLRVLHRNDGTFTGAGTGEPRTVIPVVENVFETRLPIRQGELIGVDIPGDPTIPTIESSTVPGSQAAGWDPRLADGETRVTDFAFNDRAHLYNADVEPDCDSDGLGDETQDPDTSSCNPPQPKAARTLTLDANKNKVKKGQRVRFSGEIEAPQNEAGCEPDQTVELQRKKKKAPDTAFETFVTLQSGNNGKFTTVLVAKKTRVYRAVVAETESCDDEVSNTEKVKVKKKKKK